MTKPFRFPPGRARLDRFNRSEAERLLPVWRRAAARLWIFAVAVAVFTLWGLASLWEVAR